MDKTRKDARIEYSGAYALGFAKAASGLGVSLSDIQDAYDSIDPKIRRAMIGGKALGVGTYLMSEGLTKDRMLKSLLATLAGGAGIYALDTYVK